MQHSRLLNWWKDDAEDPGRTYLDQPNVQWLITRLAPSTTATDLGGVMSLNIRLEPEGWVLRVHQPFVTRARLLALQEIRYRLASQGFIVPLPVTWRNQSVFRCGNRWAELEEYIPHVRPEPVFSSYVWLFGILGTLHRAMSAMDLVAPRPLVATYAPPGSLRRWLPVTEAAVCGDPEAAKIAQMLHHLVNSLRRQWIPAAELPTQLIHGDFRLGNICRDSAGRTVYLDFGFAASRPRIHDIAYALAFMLLTLESTQTMEFIDWDRFMQLIKVFESTCGQPLIENERQALIPYTAAVPLYAAALDGFTEDPAGKLRSRLPFLQLSEWLLSHFTS